MASAVFLSEDAERDVEDIYRNVAEHDGVMRAEVVLGKLQSAWENLASSPARGNVPKELRRLATDEYREVHYKPYRIIYEITGRRVIVHCVMDGRRDMQSLLQRRLLRWGP